MTDKRREVDEKIEKALQRLDDASLNESDRDIDDAFRTLVRVLPQAAPRHDFSHRVIAAVRREPLPAGRRRLRAAHSKVITALVGPAAVASIFAALWAMGLVQVLVTRALLIIVQGSVFTIRVLGFMPEAWRWLGLALRALTAIIGSTEMLSVFLVMTLLTVVTLAALTRVVASSRAGGL
jgi:uncharacterized membrane protein YgcG